MADSKLTELIETTTPADADIQYIVTDTGTIPASKKVTWANIKTTLKNYFSSIFGYKTFVTVGFEDADYICDGTADNVQIQAAIDYVNGLGGGIVYIKDGTYDINISIVPKSSVIIKGSGISTILQNSSATLAIFRHIDDTTGLQDFYIQNLKCIANEGGGGCWYSRGNLNRIRFDNSYFISPGTGINTFIVFFDQYTENKYITVDNCYIEGLTNGWDMIGSGMNYSTISNCTFKNGNGQGTANTGASYCNYINNCFYSVGNPISLEASHYNNIIDGNYAYYSGYFKSGLPEHSLDKAFYTKVTNNRSYYCSGGIQVGQGIGCIISGNNIIRSQGDGIFTNLSYSTISNNVLIQNNWGNSYRTINGNTLNKGGIQIINSSYLSSMPNNRIFGNIIFGDNSSWTHPIDSLSRTDFIGGIGIDTNCLENSINDNDIKLYFGVGTSEIVDGGDYTSFDNNRGVDSLNIYDYGNINGAVTFDRTDGNVIKATLTGNVTATFSSNLAIGTEMILILTQDGIGGRTISTPANVKASNGGYLYISSSAGAVDVLSFVWDGTYWNEKSRAITDSKASGVDINTGTDNDKYVTSKAIKDSYIGVEPTGLLTSIASKGGIFNGDFELDDTKTDSVLTSSYDTSIKFKGTRSLKLAFTTGANDYVDMPSKILLGNGKTYKITFWAYSSVAKSIKVNANATSQTLATVTVTANQFNQYQVTITATGDYTDLRILANDTTASNIYIDDFKIQEVTSLIPTNSIPETLLPIVQAQNTVAVDQSLDPTGAYADTYALTTGINEGATHRQTFTPTKTKGYSINIWPVAKGTGDWTVVVHDASNNLISSRTISNASVVEGAMNEWVFPYLQTAGSPYHFHVYSSVADGTLKANTTDDLETGSFIQYYSKLSEGMTVVSNGIRTNLMASSKDGLLGGSILDLDNGKWKYETGSFVESTTYVNKTNFSSNVYQASVGGRGLVPCGINDWTFGLPSSAIINTLNTAVERYLTLKIDTILPMKGLIINTAYGCFAGGSCSLQISSDNIVWTPIHTQTVASNNNPTSLQVNVPENLVKNKSIVYLRWYKASTVSDYFELGKFSIEADIDTSSIPLPTIYPLAVNQFNAQIKTSTAPARAYFRLNKFVNENNVMMPAIELTDSSGNYLGYGCFKQDNSQETSPVCNILSSSTGYQQSGTGSSVTGGYLLNDGEYMTLTGTNYNFEIDYQLGTGTTAISAITKNIAYLSSNSALADSTLDASLMANFFLGVKQQGLSSAIGDVREDIQGVKYELEKLNGLPYIRQILVNTATTLNEAHQVVMVTGATTITLPSAIGLSGRTYNIIRTGTDNVTISPVLSQTISGDASLVLTTQWDSVVIISDGANWVRCS